MSGPIFTPLDVPGFLDGYTPSTGAGPGLGQGAMMAPPIIPHLTELAPEKMRSVLQSTMKGALPDEEEAEPTPQDIIAKVGSLAYEATKFEGLPQALVALVRSVTNGVNKVNMAIDVTPFPSTYTPMPDLSSPDLGM